MADITIGDLPELNADDIADGDLLHVKKSATNFEYKTSVGNLFDTDSYVTNYKERAASLLLSNWVIVPFPDVPGNPYHSVAWSPSLEGFVAVGDDYIQLSRDGAVWELRTGVTNMYDIIWAEELGLFISVGNSISSYTSSDGYNWTNRGLPSNNAWKGCAWSPDLNLLVVVGSGTTHSVLTTSDTITWNTRNIPADKLWWDVIWASELSLFVAVGRASESQCIMTSPDGISWTLRSTPNDSGPGGSTNTYRSIAWSPELSLLVCVSDSADILRVMTSPDGINWTQRNAPIDSEIFQAGFERERNHDWNEVIWVSDLQRFVACGLAGRDYNQSIIMSSVDGISWCLHNTPSYGTSSVNFEGLAWSSKYGVLVAVAVTNDDQKIIRSSSLL